MTIRLNGIWDLNFFAQSMKTASGTASLGIIVFCHWVKVMSIESKLYIISDPGYICIYIFLFLSIS